MADIKSLLESMRKCAGIVECDDMSGDDCNPAVDDIMQRIASGECDIMDVMEHPANPDEEAAGQQLRDMFDRIAAENQLDPKMDGPQIRELMMDELSCGDEQQPEMSDEVREARRIAGLPLMERWDDDDDVRKAEEEIARQKKAGGKAAKGWEAAEKQAKRVNADKDMSRLAKRTKEEPEDDEDDEKKEEPAQDKKPEAAVDKKKAEKPVDKKEEPKETKKEEPAAPATDQKFAAAARKFLASHPNATAAEIRGHCEKSGVTVPAHFHSRLHGIKASIKKAMLKKGVTEAYVLIHPQMPTFVLAENGAMNQYQWISAKDDSSSLEPLVFENESAAHKVITYVRDYKNQSCILQKIKLGEE